MKTMVCILSQQPIPNLLPLIDNQLKPDRVIYLNSNAAFTLKAVRNLKSVLESKSIEVVEHEFESSASFKDIYEQYYQLMKSEVDKGNEVLANCTGGTKVMSIALYNAAKNLNQECFYLGIDAKIVWLYPMGKDSRNLGAQINLSDFLGVHGINLIESKASLKKLPDQYLIEAAEYIHTLSEQHIGLLSAISSRVKVNTKRGEPNYIPPVNLDKLPFEVPTAFFEAIMPLQRAGIIEFDDTKLTFSDYTALTFCQGIWFEVLALKWCDQIKQKLPAIMRFYWSVRISRTDNKTVRNELDITFLYKNTLHMIECKGKTTNSIRSQHENFQEGIAKLKMLTEDTGGLTAKGLLLSLGGIKKVHHQRSDGMVNVSVIDDTQNIDVVDQLVKWVE